MTSIIRTYQLDLSKTLFLHFYYKQSPSVALPKANFHIPNQETTCYDCHSNKITNIRSKYPNNVQHNHYHNFKFFLQTTDISNTLPLIIDRLAVKMRPACEKISSDGTDDAGIHKYFLANKRNVGHCSPFCPQNSKGKSVEFRTF